MSSCQLNQSPIPGQYMVDIMEFKLIYCSHKNIGCKAVFLDFEMS